MHIEVGAPVDWRAGCEFPVLICDIRGGFLIVVNMSILGCLGICC